MSQPSTIKTNMPEQKMRYSRISQQRVHNRLLAIMAHTTRYAFKGETRLAQDCGASPSAISRILTGQTSPSYTLAVAITRALEKHTGKRIDPREIISLDGEYPTPSVCDLMGCKGCLPAEAFDEAERLKDEYLQLRPGQWTGSIQPRKSRKEGR